MSKSVLVKTVDNDGNELELEVVKPSPKLMQESQILHASTLKRATESPNNCLLRRFLDSWLFQQKIWTDDDQKLENKLENEISDGEFQLKKGGKLKDAKQTALNIIRARKAIRELRSKKNTYDEITADAIADNARFNYLVANCTVYSSNGEKYFSGIEDYLERMGERASIDAATKFMTLLYDLDENWENQLPEIKFLQKYGFMDEKRRLYSEDKQGFIDENGKPLKEDNEQGETTLSENGEAVFTDDQGNPLLSFSSPNNDEQSEG